MNKLILLLSCYWVSFVAVGNWLQAKPAQNSSIVLENTNAVYLQNSQINELQQKLLSLTKANQTEKVILELPDLTGETVKFLAHYDPVYELDFQQKYPNIASFKAHRLNDENQTARIDTGPNGLHAVYILDGKKLYLDPIKDNSGYQVYQYEQAGDIQDRVIQQTIETNLARRGALGSANQTSSIITYRIAVAATGQYTNFYGSKSNAANGIVTSINRVNEIFERDFGIRLSIVANNDLVIFEDASTDPFENNDPDVDLPIAQTEIDNAIGRNNYDIGHLFTTEGGGLAQVGAVCGSSKAKGLTGIRRPTGDAFNIDYVSHEIAHQFGATHTFNATASDCETSRNNSAAYEIGSGVTIMGYAGICGEENVRNSSLAVFHSKSIQQVSSFITTGLGRNCGTQSTSSNAIPTANAGNHYTIPAGTPFKLTGTATDLNNDTLSYSWEQFDLGTKTSSKSDWANNGDGPIFRNWLPKDTGIRYIPDINDLIFSRSTPAEILATNTRELNFNFVVRDQVGGVNIDTTTISVNSAFGPFTVTKPNDSSVFMGGNLVQIEWDVEGTGAICSSVDISISTDGTDSFTNIATQQANSGSAQVNLPNLTTSLGKIMVACHDNIFFNLSPSFFTINEQAINQPPEITAQQVLSTLEEDAFTFSLSQFTIADQDSNQFQLKVLAGDNYQVNGDTITPLDDFFGQLNVPITVTDGSSTSEVFNASITVENINDKPTASSDFARVEEGETVTIDVLSNDTDIDSSSLTISSTDYQGLGQISIVNNQINFMPGVNSGTETFSYQITDGELTDSASVTVNVSAKAEPDITIKTTGGSGGVLFTLLLPLVLIRFTKRNKD